MKRAAVIYATREGQTALVAECIARKMRECGVAAYAIDLRKECEEVELDFYDAVVLAASVHVGRHEPEMVDFVRRHRVELEEMPSAFISVSLSQAGVEMASSTAEQRAHSVAGVQEMLDRFYAETGWRPAQVKAVAGALRYTQYNFLKRFILKQISRKAGGATDTSRDHVYTNWKELESFAASLVEEFGLTRRRPEMRSYAVSN